MIKEAEFVVKTTTSQRKGEAWEAALMNFVKL